MGFACLIRASCPCMSVAFRSRMCSNHSECPSTITHCRRRTKATSSVCLIRGACPCMPVALSLLKGDGRGLDNFRFCSLRLGGGGHGLHILHSPFCRLSSCLARQPYLLLFTCSRSLRTLHCCKTF